jgi:hypothetical protein
MVRCVAGRTLSLNFDTADQWPNPKKNMVMGPYAGADYPLMSTPESTPDTFTVDNLCKKSTLTLCQSRLYIPVGDLGFSLWVQSQYGTVQYLRDGR